MDARAAAVEVLTEVFAAGHSLDKALARVLPGVGAGDRPGSAAATDPERERALVRELCYGVLRWGPRLEAIADELLHRPLRARDADIRCLALLGLYQLLYTRIPAHAAVAATVQVAADRDKAWARGVVNAVLRRFQREHESVLQRVDITDAGAYAHPPWLLQRLRADWPQDWRRIVDAANARPPFCLRVNLRQVSREAYCAHLSAAGIAAQPMPHAAAALKLEQPLDVALLPGFDAGWVSVQDAAAQLAAGLLAAKPGDRVLDACAAPGGKAAHVLELQTQLGGLLAVDNDPERLLRVRATLERLRLSAELLRADAAEPEAWWDGRRFDRILLDAPCSGTGVIRRHPDIKRLRRPQDIAAFSALQRRLLQAAWSMLKPGGMLLYATCSIMPEENDGQITEFLAAHADAAERPIEAVWGRTRRAGRQILPGDDDMDGFYYARLEKQGAD